MRARKSPDYEILPTMDKQNKDKDNHMNQPKPIDQVKVLENEVSRLQCENDILSKTNDALRTLLLTNHSNNNSSIEMMLLLRNICIALTCITSINVIFTIIRMI